MAFDIDEAGPSVGQVLIDKYRLEETVGTGGQGDVWRATHLGLEMPVAIKLVHRSSEPSHIARLLCEARTVARLNHSAVVRVFDVEQTADGDVFIVMELLEGETLGQLLGRVRCLPPEDAIRLLLPVADALSVVHAAGVVHRDVKPDNIFLSPGEGRLRPKLLDFGTVKVAPKYGPRTTADGTFVGTPAYLAPEQLSHCDEVDPRADIWSFCVTLYECVAGRLPFEADTPTEALLATLEQEPTALSETAVGDRDLWSIIKKGLNKNPNQRWGSFDELGRALACWLLARGVAEDACGVRLASEWLPRAGGVTPDPEPPASNAPVTLVDSSRAQRRRSGNVRVVVPSRYGVGRSLATAGIALGLLGIVGLTAAALMPRTAVTATQSPDVAEPSRPPAVTVTRVVAATAPSLPTTTIPSVPATPVADRSPPAALSVPVRLPPPAPSTILVRPVLEEQTPPRKLSNLPPLGPSRFTPRRTQSPDLLDPY